MTKRFLIFLLALGSMVAVRADRFPQVVEQPVSGYFPLAAPTGAADICTDASDYEVVGIAARMLADDVERVTGQRPALVHRLHDAPVVVAGTVGKSRLVDRLVQQGLLDVSSLRGKWESFVVATVEHPRRRTPLLVVAGSDRRGTAFGLTSLCEAVGVSPWYWWADVVPRHRPGLYVEPSAYRQAEPSVQYRGIFINDERFGGWARWAEQTFDRATGKVGPATYRKVFELLLRLKANYLWPAMHPGTQPFNADPENARLADAYAIVMGSSHCEQMLRNNEGEWKAVNEAAAARGEQGLGDFNYITNRAAMLNYWEERVRTNGRYENTYTLGLRGIHDYPMEGASTTGERVALMQKAIDDQRAMLRRHIRKPIDEIPQVLCTYEEVLDAYHHGLQVPDDVTLLWSDDKHGYCRNLSNPAERRRRGGAGIYYHLSYHGDPASWIWLSPLSPSFLSTELTKAYDYGARKIWVFNVGDIKPAEKELSFVMELAWDVSRWAPAEAPGYMEYWAAKTFGPVLAEPIAGLLQRYYRLQAAGKDAHVWFVDYTEAQVARRLEEARSLQAEALLLAERVPARLKDAYFELVSYPIRGAALLNEYQLLARRSMVCASRGDSLGAMADARRVGWAFGELNQWTRHYNEDVQQGKWQQFFSWQPYHWYRSERVEVPVATAALVSQSRRGPEARFLAVGKAVGTGVEVWCDADCDVPLWMEALTPIRNFSKAAADNVFCHVSVSSAADGGQPTLTADFDASATPINNVWHAPYVGPMWSQVATLHLRKGVNRLQVSSVKPDARIDRIFLGLWPPFSREPRQRIAASHFTASHDVADCQVAVVRGLGYTDGVLTQPFGTPGYDVATGPWVDYSLNIAPGSRTVEIRTLPTLHVYEGREARYAVQVGDAAPQVFSIHANDFTAEWRLNVLRGYASRRVSIPAGCQGRQRLRVWLLDPGVVLQEVLVY